MARKYSDEEVLWGLGLVFTLGLGILGFQSGVLPWAIAGGVAVAGVVLWYTREFRTAGGAGIFTTAAILLFGGMSVLSPGWYQSLI